MAARKSKSKPEPRSPGTGKLVAGALALALLVAAAATYFYPGRKAQPQPEAPSGPRLEPLKWRPDRAVFAEYAGSESCRECHAEQFEKWHSSHHARAERPIDPAIDRPFFDPPRSFRHGTQTSSVRVVEGRLQLITQGPHGTNEPFTVEYVIGEDPLRQFLVPWPGGRWQVTELAVDPAKGDWFDVYGDEDRRAGEWGHWTGRGMNWNQMCAICHNTRLRKNYNPTNDTYATTRAEQGVGCEACHGPMADHVAWQKPRPQPAKGDPTLAAKKFSKEQTLSYCGACHSRRAEITGDFVPGEDFFDHHILTFTDETDIYYPDGQVRDEDYEYASFLSSRMYAAGVWCMDCHDPHTGKTLFPDNNLCQRCHAPPLQPAPKIDPASHTFHKPGTAGDFCVDCHMPQTVYMQRHWRRDHGFTIPDPLLTQEFNIPNACNRCHTNETAAWSLEYVNKWYGEKMDRPSRHRTRAVAWARRADTNALPALLKLAREETVPLWRATATRLLQPWAARPEVFDTLLDQLDDTNAVVRAQAVRSLEPLAQAGDPRALASLNTLLEDPVRSVRLQAAWALRRHVDTNSVAGQDMLRSLQFNLDQPGGAMQYAVFLLDRQHPNDALPWLQKAVAWDPNSAPLRDTLAYCLSVLNRPEEAVEQLRAACRLEPKQSEFRYRLALALNEAGELGEAVKVLEETVKLDPNFARAWYNLGLGYNALGRPEDALGALNRAEAADPNNADYPYARATILMQMGHVDEAIAAARRALELNPAHMGAMSLLRSAQPM